MIWRDILVGGVLACFSLLVVQLGEFISEFEFGQYRNINSLVNWIGVDSFTAWMVAMAFQLVLSIGLSLGFFGNFLNRLFVIRNKTATVVISGILLVIWVVSRQDTSGTNLFVWIVFVITLLPVIFFFNRFGIATFFSWSFFANFINTFPKTFDPNNILFAPTVTALAIVFAIMGYAAYVSIGEAKIFGEKLWLVD